jgi:hypothetical protein
MNLKKEKIENKKLEIDFINRDNPSLRYIHKYEKNKLKTIIRQANILLNKYKDILVIDECSVSIEFNKIFGIKYMSVFFQIKDIDGEEYQRDVFFSNGYECDLKKAVIPFFKEFEEKELKPVMEQIGFIVVFNFD